MKTIKRKPLNYLLAKYIITNPTITAAGGNIKAAITNRANAPITAKHDFI